LQEDNSIKTEIRLNVSKTNILRPANSDHQRGSSSYEYEDETSEIAANAIQELEEELF
jgi:hypothetical protein